MPVADAALAIADVKGWLLREPVSRRASTLVAVTTTTGLRGWGESAALPLARLPWLKERLAGKAASAIESVRALLAEAPEAWGAVNTALLDILGQAAGAPVYQALGGPTRHKARALTPLAGGSTQELRVAIEGAWKQGHRAFLVPAPALPHNPAQRFVHETRQRMVDLRAAAREADFVLDGAGLLPPAIAAQLAKALERFHLLWFDEPVGLEQTAAIGNLGRENVTPLGFGRAAGAPGVFQDLLREDAVDIIRPGIETFGISGIRKLAALAETYYVAVAPYHTGGPVATAAALHLAASLPNFFIQQIPRPAADEDRRMRAAIAGDALEQVHDGYAELPTGPGLGIRVNEDAVNQYAEARA